MLSAPTSGDYQGILFFTDRDIKSSTVNVFAGTPDTRFTGVFYFPNTDVRFTGNSTTDAHQTVFAVRRIEFQGNTTVEAYNMTRDLLPSGLAVARVVE